ncbi:MAG: 1-acyl-sn-glycerol-3-phosphate acyltransferase [Chitinophagaceae bacterium]
MLYYFLKYLIGLSMQFFYRRVTLINSKGLHLRGPLMIAANHPNSFIDALYFAVNNDRPIHVITRGDVFEKPAMGKMLRGFKLIPIFRIRDGKDKLGNNDDTADAVIDVLRKGGIVMIFVEGYCVHQTELILPLKKGSPRMVIECWKQGIDVKILPLWIRYDSFDDFGKILDANFGEAFGKEVVGETTNEASQVLQINKQTEKDLLQLTALPSAYKPWPTGLRNILWPVAMLAKLIHYPIYKPVKNFVVKKTKDTVFYDSVMLALLTFTYPVYLLLIVTILLIIFHSWTAWLVLLAFPLLVRIYLRWKK